MRVPRVWASLRTYLLIAAVGPFILSGCSTGGPSTGASGEPITAPTATLAANSAPNFKDIRAGIVRIWGLAQGSPTSAPPATAEALAQQADKDAEALTNGLKGKQVQEWQGWVTQVITDQVSGPYWVAVDMDEFYDHNPFLGFEYRGIRRIGLPDVVLTGVSEDQARGILSGEKVLISGTIKDLKALPQETLVADPANGRLVVMLERGTARAVNPTATKLDSSLDAKTATFTLTQPVCGMSATKCYTYELTVYGNGRAVYSEYDWISMDEEVTPTTTKTFQVTDEIVQHLVNDFEQAGYFSMKDDYDSYDVTDAPSTRTSLTTEYLRKSIFHYQGDQSAPNALSALEEDLDDLATEHKP